VKFSQRLNTHELGHVFGGYHDFAHFATDPDGERYLTQISETEGSIFLDASIPFYSNPLAEHMGPPTGVPDVFDNANP